MHTTPEVDSAITVVGAVTRTATPPLDGLRVWLEGTAVSHFMNWSWWAWPTAESLHFVGLSTLFATVIVFDLRLLGMLPGVRPAHLERLIPWGVGGFVLSLSTGALFFTGIPGMYLANPAFWVKTLLLLAAGANLAVYQLWARPRVARLAAGEPMPMLARLCGLGSLAIWTGVLVAGRLIAFYKP
ncbi:MAG: hypothetical protein DWQ36_16995 [Acidobacteria bacterium]|nr:MAG: hypothetical protein DWQ30_05090 [Acidobacteriota bacterium]REK04548.1 MAG: hypothetical protein DWQ36_16995 [Acidobacteriota bacterium]